MVGGGPGMKKLKKNREEITVGPWFKPAKYPKGIIKCPLCDLPETIKEYKNECHCWEKEGPE
jgi:hypothetical protein